MVPILVWAALPSAAWAYRPFDQTDGDVAAYRDVELEVGPAQLQLREGQQVYGPTFVFNYGVVPRLELVLDAQELVPVQPSGQNQFEGALLAKGLLRRGSLQGESGPSLALEVGALLPDLPLGNALGASAALIASEDLAVLRVHENAYLARTRDRQLDVVLGAIVEVQPQWRVRPVFEAWVERLADDNNGSVLGGAIWRATESLDLDAALRFAREEGESLAEIRLGFTFSFSTVFEAAEPAAP